MQHGQALSDGARLSECGIASEFALEINVFPAKVNDLIRKGFNTTEIEYFKDCLLPHGPRTYAVFWAQGPSRKSMLHFVRRTARNEYQHVCAKPDALCSILAASANAHLFHFLCGFRRIAVGEGPIVGNQFEFHLCNLSQTVSISMTCCSRLCRWTYKVIAPCTSCLIRLDVPNDELERVRAETSLCAINKWKDLRQLSESCFMLSFPAALCSKYFGMLFVSLAATTEALAQFWYRCDCKVWEHLSQSTHCAATPMRVPEHASESDESDSDTSD